MRRVDTINQDSGKGDQDSGVCQNSKLRSSLGETGDGVLSTGDSEKMKQLGTKIELAMAHVSGTGRHMAHILDDFTHHEQKEYIDNLQLDNERNAHFLTIRTIHTTNHQPRLQIPHLIFRLVS